MKVDFDYVNFDEYVKLRLAIDELDDSAEIDDIEEMYQQKKKYEDNLSTFFKIVSSKGGIKFAKKGHHELKNRSTKSKKLTVDSTIKDFTGRSWRYPVGTYVVVNDVTTEEHPFIKGDHLKIVGLEGGLDNYKYSVIHESSNNDSTFIINDEELI